MIKGKLSFPVISSWPLRKSDASQGSLFSSENKYRDLVETSNDLIWSLDERGCFTFLNRKAALKIYGYEPSEMIGRLFVDFMPKAYAELAWKEFEKVKTGIPTFYYETACLRKDGALVYLSCNAIVLKDEWGNVIGATGTASNITERKKAEEEKSNLMLRVQSQRKTLLKIATHPSVIYGDLAQALQVITEKAADVLGVERVSVWLFSADRNELNCRNLYRASIHEHSADMVIYSKDYPKYFYELENERTIIADDVYQKSWTDEFKDDYLKPNQIASMLDAAIRISGKTIGVVCHEQVGLMRSWTADEISFAGEIADQAALAILNADRQEVLMKLKTARQDLEHRVEERTKNLTAEIRTRELVEEELRRTNSFLDSIIENIPDMIFLKDAQELKFVRFNKAGEHLIGLSQNIMLGKSDFDFFPEEQARFFVEKDREVLKNKKTVDIPEEPLHTAKGKTRYLHTKKIPILDEKGQAKYLLGISEDITDKKMALEKEKKWQEQILQAEKLSSIGLLAAGVAHELNNPLTGLISLLRTYRRQKKEDSVDFRELTEMLLASDHMAKIIEDLNEFSRMSPAVYEEIDLYDVIESTLSFSEHQLRQNNIRIIKYYGERVPKIKGNKPQLQQVVLNLLMNAKDAIQKSGEVTIKTGVSTDQKIAYLEVIDTGCGISSDDLPRIFDPFFTTKVLGKGIGLGLSVLHGIVKNHKGEVLVESHIGKGSKFMVLLPVVD